MHQIYKILPNGSLISLGIIPEYDGIFFNGMIVGEAKLAAIYYEDR